MRVLTLRKVVFYGMLSLFAVVVLVASAGLWYLAHDFAHTMAHIH